VGHPSFRGASCRAKHQRRLNREVVSSQSSTGVADPLGHETGHFLSSAESATNLRVPHPSRFWRRVGYHEPRYRPSRIPPFAKSGKGWGTRLFVVLPAVPNTHGGLIEELFLISHPPALPTHRGNETGFVWGSLRANDQWVPHISLVFREMWDTTSLHRPVFHPTGKEH
jgi:hypothetical protein